MHIHQTKIKAFALSLVFVLLASLGLFFPHTSEATDAPKNTVSKQQLKKNKVKKVKPKRKKQKEVVQVPETKIEVVEEMKPVLPPPTIPLTPDKKTYGSNGHQIMTDGRVVNFRSMGVIYLHGYRYTYYSSRVLYHHRTPEWYACDDHLYRTADGYVVVASRDHAIGSIVPTPFGQGKVLDRCVHSGNIDIYVNF